MLIKRLDVTVQSFGWSERAKVRAILYRKYIGCLPDVALSLFIDVHCYRMLLYKIHSEIVLMIG